MVNAVMLADTPMVIAAVLNTMSVPTVPAEPSITCVPPLVVMRNHVAVPFASPVAALGNVGDRTAAAAPGANGVPIVNSANLVVAAPPVAGRTPS